MNGGLEFQDVNIDHPIRTASRKGKRRFSFSHPRKSKRRWQSIDIRTNTSAPQTHPDEQHVPTGYNRSAIRVKRVLHAITTNSHGPHPVTCRVRRQDEVTTSHFPRSLTIVSPTMVHRRVMMSLLPLNVIMTT
ncbi:hypothetical protein AAG906_016838 [Vitis piasezkii]